jgi:hypothetical protein
MSREVTSDSILRLTLWTMTGANFRPRPVWVMSGSTSGTDAATPGADTTAWRYPAAHCKIETHQGMFEKKLKEVQLHARFCGNFMTQTKLNKLRSGPNTALY